MARHIVFAAERIENIDLSIITILFPIYCGGWGTVSHTAYATSTHA